MKTNHWMKRLLSVLLITVLIVSALPTALASQCRTPDGTYRDHSWGPWETVKKATCTHSGQKVRYCAVCREKQTSKIAKKDHSYGSWKTTTEATCTEEGERTRKCKVCGHKQTKEIPALGHNMVPGETVTGNCVVEGYTSTKCSRCGYEEKTNTGYGKHNFGDWYVKVQPQIDV